MQTKTFFESIQKNKIVEDAYAMLAGNIYMSKKDIKSVAVTSFKTKAGKTSIATNLAIAAASWGKRTLLIDLDLRKSNKHPRDNKDILFGIADYINGRVEFEEVLCRTNINNLTYIGSGLVHSNPIGILCSDILEGLLAKARDVFDLILIDTPSMDCVTDAVLIASKADAVILVAKINKSDLKELARGKHLLDNANANLLGVVLNDVKKKQYKKYFGEYDYYLKLKRNGQKEKNRATSMIS